MNRNALHRETCQVVVLLALGLEAGRQVCSILGMPEEKGAKQCHAPVNSFAQLPFVRRRKGPEPALGGRVVGLVLLSMSIPRPCWQAAFWQGFCSEVNRSNHRVRWPDWHFSFSLRLQRQLNFRSSSCSACAQWAAASSRAVHIPSTAGVHRAMDLQYLRDLTLPMCSAHPEGEVPALQTEEWASQQDSLRAKLRDADDDGWSHETLSKIGGLDISFETGTNRATAVLVVCQLCDRTLTPIYEDAVDADMDLPYISGFLFVREVPAYELLLRRLRANAPQCEPDVFLIDGSGMFHPRQCGSASHFGIVQNLRTIGVAKKLLCFDDFDKDAGQRIEEDVALLCPKLGDSVPLLGSSGRVYGLALRTSQASKGDSSSRRVYVSVGHRCSLETAKEIILKCCDVVGGSYIPQPIRLADLTGRAIERAWTQMLPSMQARRMVMDVSNLLDNKQRKTVLSMIEEVPDIAEVMLGDIPPKSLKRKQTTIEELFLPLQAMHPDVAVQALKAALKMEKPWALGLLKAPLCHQRGGEAMRTA
ncbi:unnamed protein product [Effrenium voratum]|nr:unnamed protein product [Effrenium voratum]